MRSRDGFTLVEIVVALLVLSVGLLSTVSGLVLATRTVDSTGEHSAAGVAVVGRLELWLSTRCGGNAGVSLPDGIEGSWTTVALGSSIESTTIVAAARAGSRVRPDTFTVTGGC
ncbi:MAG: prepilin-type N-terminal cleavage/methylation domain-containing protein [Gemmatimonadota bacterium]|nr:MAG: prepilin-type N-terminal cleavage/methylation domain-containing protein [Gemmatimonadota bacterium]